MLSKEGKSILKYSVNILKWRTSRSSIDLLEKRQHLGTCDVVVKSLFIEVVVTYLSKI